MAKAYVRKGAAVTEAHQGDLRNILDLHIDPSNVRVHGEANLAAIRASLVKFGQQRPIIIDSRDIIVAGNGTYQAALGLGWTSIWAITTSLTGSDLTAYSIADNKSASLASWDDLALAKTLKSLQSEDVDLAALGYQDPEVDALLERLTAATAGTLDGEKLREPKPSAAVPTVEVDCRDAAHQAELVERLAAEGLTCRAHNRAPRPVPKTKRKRRSKRNICV